MQIRSLFVWGVLAVFVCVCALEIGQLQLVERVTDFRRPIPYSNTSNNGSVQQCPFYHLNICQWRCFKRSNILTFCYSIIIKLVSTILDCIQYIFSSSEEKATLPFCVACHYLGCQKGRGCAPAASSQPPSMVLLALLIN